MIQRELSRQIGSCDTGPPPHSFQTNITHLSLQFYSNTSCKYFYMTRCHQNELRTSSQINDTFLFHRVLKILVGGRILQISIAWCQIDGEIHSFPTMYGKGGVDVVKIGEIKVSVQKLCLKQGFFKDTNLDHLTSGWPGMGNCEVGRLSCFIDFFCMISHCL